MARRPLSELTRELTAVCMGREPADTVIRGGRLVNVHTREVLDGVDVAIAHGRVAMVGDVAHTVGSATETIDADDAFLVPGLIDTHLHVESVMVTVTRFAEAVVPHGTTTAFIDNHEMANVFGLEGMRWMLEEGRGLPLKVFLAVPSCVPALPGFEDAGAELGPDEIREALDWEGVAGLGEMMNMPGVIAGDESVHAEIAAALERGKPVTGHWSLAGVRDHRLQAYIAAGVDSCHETTSREDALAKLRSGMWVQFREGSTFRDVEALAAVITEDGVDPRHCLLVTDDVLPDTIESDGHMDRVVRRAIESGIDPLVAIQMATVNGAEYFGMRHDLGSIAPGRLADILFVEDLRDFRPHRVLADGRELGELPPFSYPQEAYRSIRLGRLLGEADLKIPAEGASVRVRAVGVESGRVTTEHLFADLPVVDGAVRASADADVAKLASIERHGGPGTIGLGFVKGLGLRRGAVASTIAHDNHNLLVAGMDDADMLFAVDRLVEAGGGMVAVAGGEVLALVELPIAGLMSDRPVSELAARTIALKEAYAELGSPVENPAMIFSFLSLGVIPALRLTNRGLVDGVSFELVPALA
ncbi:MAG TPA: adenine deaminase [Gaiellaceae bacterium]|nr:adenine deaminase [Gaiellaceae bacterium]